jgi:hypothetical protein
VDSVHQKFGAKKTALSILVAIVVACVILAVVAGHTGALDANA